METHTEEKSSEKPATIAVQGRLKPAKKRSLEDINATEENKDQLTPSAGGHTRKRSKDVKIGEVVKDGSRKVSPEPTVLEENEDITASPEASDDEKLPSIEKGTPPRQIKSGTSAALSPRKKRSREDLDNDTERDLKIAATDESRARRSSSEGGPEGSGTTDSNPVTKSTIKEQSEENGHAIYPKADSDSGSEDKNSNVSYQITVYLIDQTIC